MNTDTVKASFTRCSALGDEFFDSFYANLVDRETAIGQMFTETDMQKQNELIQEGIASLIAFAEGDEEAETHLRSLGKSHSRHFLDVRPEYYPLWVESLLTSLKEHDAHYSPELAQAWRAAVEPGIALMVSLY